MMFHALTSAAPSHFLQILLFRSLRSQMFIQRSPINRLMISVLLVWISSLSKKGENFSSCVDSNLQSALLADTTLGFDEEGGLRKKGKAGDCG